MNKISHIELDEKELAEKTLLYIYSIENTYLECSLFMNILNPLEKYEDLKLYESYLKERLSKLKFEIDYDEITFKNSISGFSDQTHAKIMMLGKKISEKENFSKEIFWANSKEEEGYQKICHFRSFEDKIIDEKKFYSALVNAVFFNVKDWILYYQDLLDYKIPEFSEKIVSGKSIIKYKPLKGKYFLGIETDYQSCKNSFRRAWWVEPEYKLVIFEKLNGNKINKVVAFEKFVHPHFDPPALSFMPFFGSKTIYDINEIETVIDYGTRKEVLEDGMIKLYNSEEFGDELKRHAYFYYDMLYHTTKEFIKFVEEAFDPEYN